MALIRVKVHPRSREERVERKDDRWEIWIKEEAREGKANEAVIKILKRFFRRVRLVRGAKSRLKLFEVEE